MRASVMLGLVIAAGSLDAGAAGIYRCTGPNGVVAYQETPCEAGAIQRAIPLPEYAPVNASERERLLQREAELDARMLQRAQLESAERIAREARYAREAELEAERERAKTIAEGPYYYPPFYARPHWPPRSRARSSFPQAR